MKLTILGTGTFYVTKERSGPAYLLEADGKKILIDCGPGTLSQLAKIGLNPEDLDYIFLSHMHADHTGDLFALQMNIRLMEFFAPEKKVRPPVIYGPKGILTFTKELSRLYQLPAFDNYDKIQYHEHAPELSLGKLTIKTFPVEHIAFGLACDAYALRLECDGKSFVFSGDSSDNQGLADSCKGADLFVCDASTPKGGISKAHLDTAAIGKISSESKVRKLVLTHAYPFFENVDLISEVKEEFDGEVISGKDLMEIEV
jgi:ribonuclease BN (tRNA processing enzyme)